MNLQKGVRTTRTINGILKLVVTPLKLIVTVWKVVVSLVVTPSKLVVALVLTPIRISGHTYTD